MGARVKLVMGWEKERTVSSVTIWLALAWLVVVFGSGIDLGRSYQEGSHL